MDKSRYPKDWPAISRRIRERDGWCCKFCGIENGNIRNGSVIVLTVAHLHDPDPFNCEDENLAALCQRCHIRHDVKLHATNAKETRRKKAAIKRMEANTVLAEVIRLEPLVQHIIDEAAHQKNQPGYNRILTYYELKKDARYLVGWQAERREMRRIEYFDAVVRTIADLLPPDAADLHSEEEHRILTQRGGR